MVAGAAGTARTEQAARFFLARLPVSIRLALRVTLAVRVTVPVRVSLTPPGLLAGRGRPALSWQALSWQARGRVPRRLALCHPALADPLHQRVFLDDLGRRRRQRDDRREDEPQAAQADDERQQETTRAGRGRRAHGPAGAGRDV